MQRLLFILLVSAIGCRAMFAQSAPLVAKGGPGNDSHWLTAAKNGFGTANNLTSKLWFTLAGGVLTEVFYPTLDVPNVQTLQLVIVDEGLVQTEEVDTLHSVEIIDERSLSFRQINTAKSGKYKIIKTYITDPRSNTLLIQIEFQSRSPMNVYVYYDPSLNNSGMHDTAWTEGQALLATDGDKASALMSNSVKAKGGRKLTASNGFLGVNDGLTELRRSPTSDRFTNYVRAENGNVVQFAKLPNLFRKASSGTKTLGNEFRKTHCTLALAFGRSAKEALQNAKSSLGRSFTEIQREYQHGWRDFVRRLPHVGVPFQRQFTTAAMTLRAMEDKTYRGATIASPSTPWGGGANANEATTSGYHAVWARDLYHVATALQALGDQRGANRALDYLFKRQQKVDGSFPQNSWLNGRPIGAGLQMDQVALPIVLTYQLGRVERGTWLRHVKPAADFIISHGPATGQDRWEEEPGYSPSTIAAEIAGLVCAAYIARVNGDYLSEAAYLRTADDWARRVESWTVTTSGPYGSGSYYLRISENDNPNDGARIEINSGGGTYDEREIVDAGFLELVRLGIKRADDPLIERSLKIIDKLIRYQTPKGTGWYRYNHDGYGERTDGKSYDGQSGIGRLWTLLTGERGEFELARGDKAAASRDLEAMLGFANDGLMIPEQVWDRAESPASGFHFGEGTGSATPLAWSMAQFIRLAMNVKRGLNMDTPAIVARHFEVGR